MRHGFFIASIVALAVSTFFAAAILSDTVRSSPDPTSMPIWSPTPQPTATPTEVVSTPETCEQRVTMADALAANIVTAMDGYDGTWAFAMYDPRCGHMAETDPDYTQYSASAGKIVSIIAALRAVENGSLEAWEIADPIEAVLTNSWDNEADYLDTLVTQEDFDAVLEIAGTESSRFVDTWRRANMSPADMARVWAALLAGDYLSETNTNLVVNLAAGAIIPEEYRTFPDGSFSTAGLLYGQKAGYYVSDGIPYFFVGAGYIVHEASGEAFFPAFMSVTENEELFDPQRRLVFPMVVDFVLAAVGLRAE